MNMLAVPEQSQVLLIEPLEEFLDHLGTPHSALLRRQFAHLSKAADQAGVPRYFAVSGDKVDSAEWLSMPCRMNTPKIYSFENDRSVWSNVDLLESMKATHRERLFICGFWLDDVVTSTALEALTLGFDTHVIVDLTLASDRSKRCSAMDRLNQYTIAPVSLRNLLCEWMIQTEDAEVRSELKLLWEGYEWPPIGHRENLLLGLLGPFAAILVR